MDASMDAMSSCKAASDRARFSGSSDDEMKYARAKEGKSSGADLDMVLYVPRLLRIDR
jgi:hypothetical protein